MSDRGTTAAGEAMGWMPLRLVALAPLAGGNDERPDGLVRIVKGSLDEAMASVAPRLKLKVKDPSSGSATEVQLNFRSMDDFRPERILAQVPETSSLLEERDSQADKAAGIDAALNAWLDAIIHKPAFLELEAAWRGVDYLASRGEAGAGSMTPFALEVLCIGPREDYLARYRSRVFDPDYEDQVETPMAATLIDGLFDHQPASMERLTALAGLANALQSPVIGSVGPSMFGMKNLAHLPALADLVTRTTGGPYGAFNAFQQDNTARWVGLTCNRFLLRPAWTPAPDTDVYQYTETVDQAHPEWLCWGNAVWALGASLARSYAEHGHCAASDGLSGTGGHHGLSTRALQESPTKKVQVTTEIVVSDEKAWELCRAGFTPFIGIADGDIAYFPFLGNLYRPQLGSLTMDQTLTYQLYAGQLSHVLLKLAGQAPAGDPTDVCRWFEQQIFNYMSPFVGDKPGDNVKVSPESLPDGTAVAAIRVDPTFKIQDKNLDLQMQLPLR